MKNFGFIQFEDTGDRDGTETTAAHVVRARSKDKAIEYYLRSQGYGKKDFKDYKVNSWRQLWDYLRGEADDEGILSMWELPAKFSSSPVVPIYLDDPSSGYKAILGRSEAELD